MKRFLRSLMILTCGGLVLAACTVIDWRDEVLKGNRGYVYVGVYEALGEGTFLETKPMADQIRFENPSPNATLFKDEYVLVEPVPIYAASGSLKKLYGESVFPGRYELTRVTFVIPGYSRRYFSLKKGSRSAIFTVRNGEALYLGMYELRQVCQPASGKRKCATLLVNRSDFAAFKKMLAKQEPKIAPVIQYRPLTGPVVVQPQ